MASRKSSILKPRKAREPLQDLNQLLPNNDDEETTITTGLAGKRRVSFASMNKVKEFESAAECLTLLNTPAYDERFSISSDSCQSSVLGSSHAESQKMVFKENSVRDDIALEEEIELTETVGGRICESSMKSRAESSMEFTTPYSAIVDPRASIVQYDVTNLESKTDCDTSCMETTEVITNNLFSGTVYSQLCQDIEYEEGGAISECQNMEISPFREVPPPSRKSIFHRDENVPTRKSIFDIPTPQLPKIDFLDDEKSLSMIHATRDESILMDMSIPLDEDNEKNLLPRASTVLNFEKVDRSPKRSIFSQSFIGPKLGKQSQTQTNIDKFNAQPARAAVKEETGAASHNSSLPILSQTLQRSSAPHNSSMQPLINRTEYNNSSMQLVSQNIEVRMELRNDEDLFTIDDSCMKLASQNENKTRCNNSNMHLVSQEMNVMNESRIEKTSFDNSVMQVANQVINAIAESGTDKTRCNNSAMQLASQEEKAIVESRPDETRCNNSVMQLASQETNVITESRVNKTCYNNSSMQPASQEVNVITESQIDREITFDTSNVQAASPKNNAVVESRIDSKTRLDNSNMQLVSQEINVMTEFQISKETRYDDSNMHFVSQEVNAVIESQNVLINEEELVNSTVPLTSQDDRMEMTQTANPNTNTTRLDEDRMEMTQTANLSANGTRHDISTMQLTDRVSVDTTSFDEMTRESVTGAEVRQIEPYEGDEVVPVDDAQILSKKDDINETKTELQKSLTDPNSSSATSDSNSPLTVGVNFSIFQKNKETRVEFSGTIDSNKKERSKSISNVQVNIINNKVKKEDRNVQKLRFSMPASKSKYDETKPRVYASFVDVSLPSDTDLPKRNAFNAENLEPVKLMSPIVENESHSSHGKIDEQAEETREPTTAKKRLSSEMLMGENEEDITTAKRRSISTIRSCEMVKEMTIKNEHDNLLNESALNCVENADVREVCTSTQVTQRRESIMYEDQSSIVAIEKVIVETCSKLQTLTCTTSKNENEAKNSDCTQTLLALSVDENCSQSRNFTKDTAAGITQEFGEARENVSLCDQENDDETAAEPNMENTERKSQVTHTAPEFVSTANSKSQCEEYEDESTVGSTGVNDKTCDRKSVGVANLSSKVSLSDNEPSTKDRSEELVSDSDSNRWAAPHSTPFRKSSIKSVNSHSILEDDLIDSLNNPSIIVNIGDSFSQRSSDLYSANISTMENRDTSSSKEGNSAKVRDIESIPSDNVSKVSFVSDWLQNKMGKIENRNVDKVNSVNHSSSSADSNKILVTENTSKEEKVTENAPAEAMNERNLESSPEESKIANTSPILETEPAVFLENAQSRINVEENTSIIPESVADNETVHSSSSSNNVSSSTKLVADDEINSVDVNPKAASQPTENDVAQSLPPNLVGKNVPVYDESVSNTVGVSAALSTQLVSNDGTVNSESLNAATNNQCETDSEMITDTQNLDHSKMGTTYEVVANSAGYVSDVATQFSTMNGSGLDEAMSQQNAEILDEDTTQRKPEVADNVEPGEKNILTDARDQAYNEVDCVDRDEEIDLDLMEISADNIDPEDENQTLSRVETSPHEISGSKALKHELAVETLKKEILERIRSEHLSGNSAWRLKFASCNEWIFQVSNRGLLALVVNVVPAKTDCSASLKFLKEPPNEYHEILHIGLRALRQKCRKKIKTSCRTIYDLPFLLKSVMIDVEWMKNFVQDLSHIASWEDVHFKKGKASFSVSSYKNLILFDVCVDLNNLGTLSVDDVAVVVKCGKIDINCVRRIFSESGRDYNFFSKFVERLVLTYDS